MIKHIYGNGQWVNVSQSGTVMPYLNATQPMSGMIRMNSSLNRLEVYDGQTWIQFGGDVQFDLSENAKQVLTWANDKMKQEQQLKELMSRHPGLQDLNDKFEMMKILCQEEENTK